LRDLGFGAIMNAELIDVRYVLLADSPLAPDPGARTFLRTGNNT
jgi:hypothetical protein